MKDILPLDFAGPNIVLTAMSGGVDSTAAALLLQRQGHDVIGINLKLFTPPACSQEDGAQAARSAAQRLGIPFYVFDFSQDFGREVMDRFANAYLRGETPNPCVDCNRYVKLGKLFRRAEALGCGHIATGHYARVEQDSATGRWLLRKGLDQAKDQSYFLYSLTQPQLAHLLLPLGGLTKPQVRALAQEAGMENAQRQESQDICFVPGGDYAAFIRARTGIQPQPGDFVGTAGQVYGQHRGILNYTVGQRKGLGLSFPQPMYVCALRPESNQVVLGENRELFSRRLTAGNLNFISVPSLPRPASVKAKIRYRHQEQPATAVQTGPDQLEVVFDQPQRAITKGQAVVLYDGDKVIGGGTIL